MTKPEKLEKRLNNLRSYPPCWVYREGKQQYIIQSVATGETIKNFYSYTDIEEYIIQLEENEGAKYE